MQALVFHGPWRLRVEDVPAPDAADGEVLLEILATGICGSDLHGYTGESGRRHPGQVMGHETVARVLTDPSGRYEPGRLVTVNPVIGCGACGACRAGRTQRCSRRVIIGVAPDVVSAFAQRLVVPQGNVVPLPSEAPAEIGALVEPLAVGYHAARRGAVGPGASVLVVGGGPIGQAAALAARRLEAGRILVSEPDEFRRGRFAALAIEAVDPTRTPADQIVELLGGPANVVIDAVGTSETAATALACSETDGRVVLVGMNAPRLELDAYAVSTFERTLIGSFCYDVEEFEETARWVTDHADLLGPLVDHRVELAEAPQVFRALADRTLPASKVLVYPNGLPDEGGGAR